MSHQLKKDLEKVLLENNFKVPYCSFSELLKSQNVQVPKQLGGSCLTQTQSLSIELEKFGIETKTIEGIESCNLKHYSLIGDLGKTTYFFDPFLMINTPVNLSKVLKSKKKVIYSTNPECNGENSLVEFCGENSQSFTVSSFFKRQGIFSEGLKYKYNMHNVEGNPDFEVDLEPFRFQKKLSLRVCFPQNVWTVNLYTNSDLMDIRIFDGDKSQIFRQKNQGQQKFFSKLDELGERIGLPGHKIYSYFYDALEIYKNNLIQK